VRAAATDRPVFLVGDRYPLSMHAAPAPERIADSRVGRLDVSRAGAAN